MNARTWVVFLLGAALGLAPANAVAGEGTDEGGEPKKGLSTDYERGRFLLDGGFHGYYLRRPTAVSYYAFIFFRGRYQLNRYVAIEQTNRVLVPFPFASNHLVGIRGQIPLPNGWSTFVTARVGLQYDVFGFAPSASAPGFKGQIAEAGIGVERLAPTDVLYGLELGAAKYFGRLLPNALVPHARVNIGYAF